MARTLPLDLVSRYRAPIYGISILWIVLFHAIGINELSFTLGHDGLYWIDAVIDCGNVGVDVFLFLSGISLYFSFSKKPPVNKFIFKRLVRIFPVVIAIAGPYFLVRYAILNAPVGLAQFATKISLLDFWVTGNSSIWYGSLIVALYFAYPYIYWFLYPHEGASPLKRGLPLIAVTYLMLFALCYAAPDCYWMTEIALMRIPIFLFGCMMGKYVYEHRSVPLWVGFAAAAIAIAFIIVFQVAPLHRPWTRVVLFAGGVSFSYAFALVFWAIDTACKNHPSLVLRFLALPGAFSFELYVAHIVLNQIMRLMPWYYPRLAFYLAMAVLAFFVAWGTKKFVVDPVAARLSSPQPAPKATP